MPLKYHPVKYANERPLLSPAGSRSDMAHIQPNFRTTFLGGPCNKDCNIEGSILGPPCLGKLPNPKPDKALQGRNRAPIQFLFAFAIIPC